MRQCYPVGYDCLFFCGGGILRILLVVFWLLFLLKAFKILLLFFCDLSGFENNPLALANI